MLARHPRPPSVRADERIRAENRRQLLEREGECGTTNDADLGTICQGTTDRIVSIHNSTANNHKSRHARSPGILHPRHERHPSDAAKYDAKKRKKIGRRRSLLAASGLRTASNGVPSPINLVRGRGRTGWCPPNNYPPAAFVESRRFERTMRGAIPRFVVARPPKVDDEIKPRFILWWTAPDATRRRSQLQCSVSVTQTCRRSSN